MFNLHLYSQEALSDIDIKPFWEIIKNLDDFISIDQDFMCENFDSDELDDLSDDYPDLDDEELYQKQVKKSPNFKKWKDVKFAYYHHLDSCSPSLVTFDWCPQDDIAWDTFFLEFTKTNGNYEYSGTLADQLFEQSEKIKKSNISQSEKQEQFEILKDEAIVLFTSNPYLSSLDKNELSKKIEEFTKL
jgi:hypothetical protein